MIAALADKVYVPLRFSLNEISTCPAPNHAPKSLRSEVTAQLRALGVIENGLAVVGTPDEVRATLVAQLAESGANYLGCRFAFGDLTLEESLHSLDLFTREVMPHLRANERRAAS